MSDFAKALDQEIADLLRELEADPRHVRLGKLKELRRLYGEHTAPISVTSKTKTRTRFRLTTSSKAREKILVTAASIIRGRTTPTSTADILAEIKFRELTVHGKDPRNTLSAMLSNADEFVSHGRSGWTLAEPSNEPGNTEAADDNPNEDEPSAASDRVRSDQPENPAPLWSATEERG